MRKLPMLIFPRPVIADREKKPRGFVKAGKPSHAKQIQQSSKKYPDLQKALSSQNIEIHSNISGLSPESVLVLETKKSIDDFAEATNKVEEFEWMYYSIKNVSESNNGVIEEVKSENHKEDRVFVVMKNEKALYQLIKLWKEYDENKDIEFETGLAPFKKLFHSLNDIRWWSAKDRLSVEMKSNWKFQLENSGNEKIPFEIELWYRKSQNLRKAAEKNVLRLVQELNGSVRQQFIEIKEIAYNAALVDLPRNAINSIIADQEVKLVNSQEIMLFRPIFQTIKQEPKDSQENLEIISSTDQSLPKGDPIIALFDGYPLENHELLKDRIIVDDPDNYVNDYEARYRYHGTGMASAIIHGDLNISQTPQSAPIYIRPILKVNSDLKDPSEEYPNDCLMVDLIHRAVKRIFEGEDDNGPIAPSIKIINLAIGDPNHQFLRSMSPIARLIDWLSFKYNVLFIVSAGNHDSYLTYDLSESDIEKLSLDEVTSLTVKSLYKKKAIRKLLSPAETINGLTVGALHNDEFTGEIPNTRKELISRTFPSPISAFGGGYRKSIKPEIVYNGGRFLYRVKDPDAVPVEYESVTPQNGPGVKVAYTSPIPGNIKYVKPTHGTSNSTALMSRTGGFCFDMLSELFEGHSPQIDKNTYLVPILKSLLVHGCSIEELYPKIENIIDDTYDGHSIREAICQWIGYGAPSIDKILGCSDHRTTVLGFGELSNGKANAFKLPLPKILESVEVQRQLTVTLAWLTPISPHTQKYRTADLWFKLKNEDFFPDRIHAGLKPAERGTVQHLKFEGLKPQLYEEDFLEIKVNCREDAGKIEEPIRYGLAVTIEVDEGFLFPIYDEIASALKLPVKVS